MTKAGETSNGASRLPTKRTRGYLACISCRKQKARCEILDSDPAVISCKRCKHLRLECSFHSQSRPVNQLLALDVSAGDVTSPIPPSQLGFFPLGPPLAHDGNPKRRAVGFTDPKKRLWSFLTPSLEDPVDWSSPISAIHILLDRAAIPKPPTPLNIDTSLRTIVSEVDIQQLLAIFHRIYEPWLNFVPRTNPSCGTDLLEASRCLLALRYCPVEIQQLYGDRLHSYSKSLISTALFDPPSAEDQVLELIQSLIILGTWSHVDISQSRGGISEGKTLLAAAVGFAMDLRLNQLSTLCRDLETDKGIEKLEPGVYDEMRWKISLWISLSVQESLACTGKGRVPVSRRSTVDSTFFSRGPGPSAGSARETRLRLLSELCDLTEKGTSMKFDSCGYEVMQKNMSDFASTFEQKQSFIEQLAAISESDSVFFHLLKLQSLLCKYCTLYQASFEIVHGLQRNPLNNPFMPKSFKCIDGEHKIDPQKLTKMQKNGLMVLMTCQDILTTFISLRDTPGVDHDCLTSFPDGLFVQMVLATLHIIGLRWFIKIHGSLSLPGYTEPLLAKVVDHLEACATCSNLSSHPGCQTPQMYISDHPAAKCARFLRRCTVEWDKFLAAYEEAKEKGEESPLYSVPLDPDTLQSFSSLTTNSHTSPPEHDFLLTTEFISQIPSNSPVNWDALSHAGELGSEREQLLGAFAGDMSWITAGETALGAVGIGSPNGETNLFSTYSF